MKSRNLRHTLVAKSALLLVPALALLLSSSAHAGNTWDGGGTPVSGLYNWSDNANWDSDTAPSYATLLTFGGTSGLTSNNNGATGTIAGITFSSGAGAFTLSGSSVTLGGNITNSSTSLQRINLALVLNAARTVNLGSGDVILGGAISGGFNLIVSGGTARTATMNTAGSSYNRLQINSATAKLGVDNALPTTGGVTFAAGVNGGRLDLNGKTQTLGSTIVFAGGLSTGTATITDSAGGGLLKLGGNVTQNVDTGTPTVNISAALDFNGATRTFAVNSTDTGATGGVANGVITLSGAITNSTGSAGLTKTGVGILNISGGGASNTLSGAINVNAGTLAIDNVSPSPGIQSFQNMNGDITVASGATFNFSQSFTAHNLDNNITLSGAGTGGLGALNLWRNATATGTITLAADATISHTFNRAIIDGTITGADRNLTLTTLNAGQPGMEVNGQIQLGTGGVTIIGVANTYNGQDFSVKLTGNNSYSGNTTVSAGTLYVSNTTGSGTGSGTVTVNSGATLGGTGSIAGNIAATGAIAPGEGGIGTLKAGGDVTWYSGNAWKFDLSSNSAASDKLEITGALTKSGSGFVFDFMNISPKWGETFTLATFASTTFTLSDIDLAASIATLGAGSYSASSFAVNSTSLTFTAVPEPTSALAALLLSAGLFRRRRA